MCSCERKSLLWILLHLPVDMCIKLKIYKHSDCMMPILAQKQPKPPSTVVQDQPDKPSRRKQEPAESTGSNFTCRDDSFTWWGHNYDCSFTTGGLISYYMVLCCETEFNTEETHTFFGNCHTDTVTVRFLSFNICLVTNLRWCQMMWPVDIFPATSLQLACSWEWGRAVAACLGPCNKLKSIIKTHKREHNCTIQEVPCRCIKRKYTLLLVSDWFIPASDITRWWDETFPGHYSVWHTYLALLLWFLPQGPQGQYR